MNKQEEPLVSILMTVFNREKYIAEAVESVLASTYKNWELIIVDDLSTDDSVQIAQTFVKNDSRIFLYENCENLGDYPNRNKAASYAKGKYLKYLDSDDMIYPHGLEVMVKSMEAFPNAGYGLSSMPDTNEFYPACVSPQEAYLENFLKGFGHFNRSPGSSIIRNDIFHKVGGFSGKRMIGDNEMWLKLSQEHDLVKFPRDLVWHRSHDEQESQSSYAQQYEILRKEVIDNALKSPECPLNVSQIEQVDKHLKRQKIKYKVLRYSSAIFQKLK